MRVGNSLSTERDESMRMEGLQARGAYKEVPSLAFGQALATPESSQAMQPSKGQKIPYMTPLTVATTLGNNTSIEDTNSQVVIMGQLQEIVNRLTDNNIILEE